MSSGKNIALMHRTLGRKIVESVLIDLSKFILLYPVFGWEDSLVFGSPFFIIKHLFHQF